MVFVFGVDFLMQFCKVVVFDFEMGVVVWMGCVVYFDGMVVDLEVWWIVLWVVIDEVGGFDDIVVWLIGGQQYGMVVLDFFGVVICDVLLWNDICLVGVVFVLVDVFGVQELVDCIGVVFVVFFMILKVWWLCDVEFDNVVCVVVIVLLYDWFIWWLCGFGLDGVEGVICGLVLDEFVID